MRRGSVVFEGRTLIWAVATVATALFVLGPAATAAFGQDSDGVQYSAVCQNIIGSIGDITQSQTGTADAVAGTAADAQYSGEAVAEVAQEQGVSIGQVNECLNGQAPLDGDGNGDGNGNGNGDGEPGVFTITSHGKVLTASIPDKNALAATGGMPLPGLAILGLGLMAAGASLLRFGGWR